MAKMEFDEITTETAPKLIAKRIKEAILSGELGAEARLPTEEELAAQFRVSRGTIREALKRLAAENLLESRRGASGGNFVRIPTSMDMQTKISEMMMLVVSVEHFTYEEVLTCRYELGNMCIALAAANRSDAQLARLEQEVVIQKQPLLSDVDFCASDVRFHCEIAEATGNPVIASVVSGVFEGVEPISNFMLYKFRERETIFMQHERILEALRMRTASAALDALAEQFEYFLSKHHEAAASQRARKAILRASKP